MKRRQFIVTLGAGSALLMFPSFAKNIIPADKKLGIALVGLGNYAMNLLAPALQQTLYCELRGLVTGTPEKAETYKKEYNIPDSNIYNYETFDRIADNKNIDVVYVVLPNSMHHDYVIRAAKAGKHVFCEKPMAVSVKECQEMIDACKKAGVRLFIGYRLHTDPFHKAAMQFGMDNKRKIQTIESEFAFRIGDPNQWRLKKALAGGGALMDLGIYCIQAGRYCSHEEPLTVTAQESKTDPVKFKEVDETMQWQMDFPSGAVSKSMCSYSQWGNRLLITAGQKWFKLEPAFSYNRLKGETDKGPLDITPVNQQAVQMDTFSRCIMENKPTDAGGEEGLKDLKVIEAIYRSVASGKKENVV